MLYTCTLPVHQQPYKTKEKQTLYYNKSIREKLFMQVSMISKQCFANLTLTFHDKNKKEVLQICFSFTKAVVFFFFDK